MVSNTGLASKIIHVQIWPEAAVLKGPISKLLETKAVSELSGHDRTWSEKLNPPSHDRIVSNLPNPPSLIYVWCHIHTLWLPLNAPKETCDRQ